MTDMVLALIPARGGSKSIPRKNLQLLHGKPLIAYSIEQALNAGRIGRVVVSTDDDEIARTALKYGAEVPFLRPPELAADETPDLPVFQHALRWFLESEGYTPVAVVHLRPTHPVRRVAIIDAAIEAFLSRADIDSVRSVNLARESPYKMWRIGAEGYLTPVVRMDDGRAGHSQPRQELPRVYWQNGYVDVIRPEVILDKGAMGGGRILPFVTEDTGVEIDYPEDLREAERLMLRSSNVPAASTSQRFPS
jgi:CMP-N,N'-diacetyllegionaminic acid synthase